MGVIGKLAFWRRSSGKAQASVVEIFEAPAAAAVESSPQGEVVRPQAEPAASSPEKLIAANPQDDEALAGPTGFIIPSSSSSSHPSPAHQSPKRVAPSSMSSQDADELEAELCDEVLFPLPEPKHSPEATTLGCAAALGGQDEINFERPLDEMFAGVSQAFGPMIASSLQSPKWDKRAQALKAVGSMLRGLDLQGMAAPGSTGVLGKVLCLNDRIRCWRSCCELLHYVMCDKVMPVRLASHELFTEAFGCAEGLVSQEECHFALNVLIQHAIERLGDSNLRLHDSARKCVCFCSEKPFLLGLQAVLAKLKVRLSTSSKGGERQKVYNGVIDACNFLLQHFPGRRVSSRSLDDDEDEEGDDATMTPADSWTAADIAPFVAAGMDDSLGPRVRSTVIILAVTVYQTFGMEAMQPVLQGLRPAKQALLRQKFQESEDMDGEDFNHDTHCGTTATTMASKSEGAFRNDDMFNDLMICGSKVMQPRLPGSLEDPDEEDMMDGILEETGMAFASNVCTVNEAFGHDSRCLRPVPGLSRHLLVEDLEEEHRILEEELLNLDMDLDQIDDQEAYLESLGPMRNEMQMRTEVY